MPSLQVLPPVEKVVWDLTHACPLRCAHCYSESGRRASGTPTRERLQALTERILATGAQKVVISGGEPLLVDGWQEAVQAFHRAGREVTVFTSGFQVSGSDLEVLLAATAVTSVSLDGATAATHDRIRGRDGAWARAWSTLERLLEGRLARASRGEPSCRLSTDFTVMRSNFGELPDFVQKACQGLRGLDALRIGMAIPSGLAAEASFEADELLTDEEADRLMAGEAELASLVSPGVTLELTEVRPFHASPFRQLRQQTAHLEPDGQLRAIGVLEAKVGNILEEPFDQLWERVQVLRNSPAFAHLRAVRTMGEWAALARHLDATFGSAEDRIRLSRRTASRGPAQAVK